MVQEILVATPAIRALIRDDKVQQIYSMIQSGQKFGMKTLNMSLYEVYSTGKVSLQTVLEHSHNAEELNEMIAKKSSPAFA